MATDFDFKK
jgi:hypothetical protein